MYAHRHAMQKKLGRPLLPTEVVHHIDFDRENNDLSNLKLYASQALHRELGHGGEPVFPGDKGGYLSEACASITKYMHLG